MAHETDVLIIGAGPTGLFAAYYAGFRGLRVAVVDSLPELGGQITAMYPEKAILDVAGLPRPSRAATSWRAWWSRPRPRNPSTSSTAPPGRCGTTGTSVTIGLDDGTEVTAGAVIITAGIGKFSPRPLPAGDGWLGRGWSSSSRRFQPYAGKDVVIVGGGDSAFDWALHLEPVARSVTLVHRRDAFRAHAAHRPRGAGTARSTSSPAQVTALRGEATLAEVEITVDGQEPVGQTGPGPRGRARLHRRPRAAPGVGDRGREAPRRGDSRRCRRNLPRVFAAGDITEYPGKVRLIAVGFGEAATAVNNAAVAIDPSAHVFPGHSSEGS